MKKYKYIGNQQMDFTLSDNSEFLLQPNDEVDLPNENEHIKTLIAMIMLLEIKEIKITKTDK